MIIPLLYRINKHTEIRKIVEMTINERETFLYNKGTRVKGTPPIDIKNPTQEQIKYYRYDAQALFQSIRIVWDYFRSNTNFTSAFNNLVTYGESLNLETIKQENNFIELGKRTQNL